ncbi:MAG TPA: GAF domain-containing protein [Candidatus Limnocylindria bacterium]|nr:GAF domain-containing protein [Candidatus Limnocylindria bacterium]
MPDPEALVSERDALAAVGRVLATVSRSGFELQPILDSITAEAPRLCRADVGFCFLREGDQFRFVSASGGSPEHWEYERAHPDSISRDTIVGRVALAGAPVQIEDLVVDPDYRGGAYKVGGYRTLLGVPIQTHDGLIGALGLGRTTVSPFSHDEIELVSLFADQAAIAIRLARLLAETHEALERETAVGQVLQSISRSTFELDGVLQTVLDNAVRLSHADQGNITREIGGAFRARVFSHDVPPEFRELMMGFVPGADRGSAMGRALLERAPIQIVDVLADADYKLSEAQHLAGFRTILGVPMFRDGDPIGVLSVWRRHVAAFTPSEISLLTTFADQAALAIENVRLFETIARQRTELARFAPQAAELLSSEEGEDMLAGHRREITTLFADLRGFTAFAEQAEPEEVLGVLREYHGAVGELAVANGGTVEHFAGDGLMVFFNDPKFVDDHQFAAVRTAVEMRERFGILSTAWRKRGYVLGLGIGIATGFATLGRIGFEGRYDYAAIGNSVILASRLSDAAAAGQILVSQRVLAAIEDRAELDPVPDLELKGFSQAMTAYAVTALGTPAAD